MIDWSWITSTGTELLMVALSGVGVYLALLLFTRVSGLRSFSKLSTFDFAITVAFGSIVASTVLTEGPSLAEGAAGLAILFVLQYLISRTRRLTRAVEWLVDNEPLLLMTGDGVIEDHLNEARVTVDDVRSKLRLAGVTHRDQVFAVILETTGEMSVLKTCDDVSHWVFEDVRGSERLVQAVH